MAICTLKIVQVVQRFAQTLNGLSNVVAFALLKILHNLGSMQTSLFANNC